MTDRIRLRISELKVPFKMTFRHASASRSHGESVWAEASRGEHRGFGEGCPRAYVTGETRDSCRAWLTTWQPVIERECLNLQTLRSWLAAHTEAVDAAPSAWCAVECALLDLFAREHGESVEALVGLAPPGGPHIYTAVIGNDELWKTRFLIDQSCILGLTDFKVKLDGDLSRDRQKLGSIGELAAWHRVTSYRIRVDANNLWADSPDLALEYLRALEPLWAVEEPVKPRDVERHSEISVGLGVPIILDESLCTLADLERYDGAPGRFIANVKVSRVGGVLRALNLVEALRARAWPVIIGAHAGETSVLTRAGMLVAAAAGDALIGQEGGFGSRLLEREPASPSLKWGRAGVVDLRRPYAEVTTHGLQVTPSESWTRGWGLTCGTPGVGWDTSSEALAVQRMSDDYDVHYRLWGPDCGADALVVLHGGMSHSAWQRPLANAIRAQSTCSVFAPDRRGCGLNANPGDLGSVVRAIEDVVEHVRMLGTRFERVHLAGWCQGAQFAAVAAEQLQGKTSLQTLLLITPGFFWNARFRSVIEISERIVHALLTHFNPAPDRDDAFIPIPLQPTDFTLSREGLDFIDGDRLKTSKVTLKSVVVMDEVQERSWESIVNVRVPLFVLTARQDRIVDNEKVRAYLAPVLGSPGNTLVEVDTGHAVQFEQPEALAASLLDFIQSHSPTNHQTHASAWIRPIVQNTTR